jgi:heme-degrading monooxygenase HmoA
MLIVMNRFSVNPGRESDFEVSWRGRETYLKTFDGFEGFVLLRNQAAEGPTEFISHTRWATREHFDAWRSSDEFRRAHGQGGLEGVLAGPPRVAVYDSVIEETPDAISS